MAIAAAITFIISTSYSMNLYNKLMADVQKRAEMYDKLEQIDAYVRSYYDGEIDENKLIESLAEAYISVIGSQGAVYYGADSYTLYKERLSGTHLGVGLYVEEAGGYPCVTGVVTNSPAEIMGIKQGESIIAIDGVSVTEMGYQKAYSMLRAEIGTILTLTLRSDGEDRDVTLSSVNMTSAAVRAIKYGECGYIQVYEFNEKTYQQFIAAYSMLQSSEEIKGLIIDLRNNTGLIHEPVFNLLNTILPVGSTPYVTSELGGEEVLADMTAGTDSPTVPIVVLVNGRTSGPAELFAASIRDSLYAPIVGSVTAGKGKLYKTYGLYDNTGISLPIATLRSSVTAFDGVGIKPDYEVIMTQDTNAELAGMDENSDACLKKAIEILSQSR